MYKTMMFLTILLCTYSQTYADSVPSLINYQGMLTDSDGKSIEGAKKLEFNIFDSESGGTNIWGPQIFSHVPVIKGMFNVILGTTDVNGRPIRNAFNSEHRYLAIKVGDNMNIMPRQRVLSTPYSLIANVARTVEGRTMMIKDNGNVGIGTDNPGDKLDVKGNISANPPINDNHVVTKSYLKKWGGDEKRRSYGEDKHSHTYKTTSCPNGYYVVGINVKYGGTCKHQCSGDGGIIQNIELICRPIGNN